MAERSLTISFISTAQDAYNDKSVDVEFDSTMNDGKTQFLYGEKAYYKIFTYPSSATITQVVSDGAVTEENSGYNTVVEQVNFANSNEGALGYPVYDIVSTNWLGTDLGSISTKGRTAISALSGVGVLNITYRTFFRRYAISIPTKSELAYNILVYISI